MMLEQDERLLLVGMDRDPSAVRRACRTLSGFEGRSHLCCGDFRQVRRVLQREKEALQRLGVISREREAPRFDRILADLGISSDQLDDPSRGFAFSAPGPLDMRMDPQAQLTAESIVNTYSLPALTGVLKRGGVGREAGRIARAIIKARPLHTTTQLAAVCRTVQHPAEAAKKHRHPGTVVFQALRIAVNGELQALQSLMDQALDLLAPSGRLAVISFHSLEDQQAASAMRAWSRPADVPRILQAGHAAGKLLTRKAILPGADEVEANPRARSARMRIFERAAGAEEERA